MLKVEIVKRHFVNTFSLKLICNVGGAGDWPDHVFCAPVGGPEWWGRGDGNADLCASVFMVKQG